MIFLKHLMSCGMGQEKLHPTFLYDPVAQPVEHRPFHTEEESIFTGGELSVKHSFPR